MGVAIFAPRRQGPHLYVRDSRPRRPKETRLNTGLRLHAAQHRRSAIENEIRIPNPNLFDRRS